MSCFKKNTKHPITGKWEKAEWIDDYFGEHKYGVQFSDGSVFEANCYKWETKT